MLKRLRDLETWAIHSRDKEDVGTVEDFYFDDQRWTVRYLLVNAGGWLTGNLVLISPMAVRRTDWQRSHIDVDLSRDQIRNAPIPQKNGPMTREFERRYGTYFGYPNYWVGPSAWGMSPTPVTVIDSAPGSEPVPIEGEADGENAHLHSVNEVSGYHIHALDGEIGHVEDLLFDPDSWTIRYLAIDTSNWIGGRSVLVAPEWVRRVDWTDQLVHVDMSRDSVKNSPQYDPTVELTREYEDRLRGHYHRPVYWK